MKIFTIYSSLSNNIGDDMQTFAVEQIIDGVDGYVDRENLSKRSESGILIANGWWKHNLNDFPPSDHIVPIYIGLHLNANRDFYEKHAAHLNSCGPIGCRDYWTLTRMRKCGIEAYYSGCLTLGLQRWLAPDSNGPIIGVDIPPLKGLSEDIISISHNGPLSSHPDQMRKFTLERLELYQKASLVVTTRLHVALPCLAFGTPIIFVSPHPSDPRFGAINRLLKIHHPSEQFLAVGETLPEVTRKKLQMDIFKHLENAITKALWRINCSDRFDRVSSNVTVKPTP